jgi:hypothetical protein
LAASHPHEDDAKKTIVSSSIFGLTDLEELPAVSSRYVRVLFLLVQVMYLSFYLVALARMSATQDLLDRVLGHPAASIVLIVTAAVGIPIRLYLFSAAAFDLKDLSRKFLKLVPGILIIDVLWALSPFLLAPQIGMGLALGATAALLYVPFAQRTLVLMRQRTLTPK